jgi:hypothetical protein
VVKHFYPSCITQRIGKGYAVTEKYLPQAHHLIYLKSSLKPVEYINLNLRVVMKIAKQVKKVETQPIIKKLLYWSVFVFILKLIIIFNISTVNFQFTDGRIFQIDNIWLGADGGNYLKGYEAILKDGIFSSEPVLNYWPAGYPLLMFLISLLDNQLFFHTPASFFAGNY